MTRPAAPIGFTWDDAYATAVRLRAEGWKRCTLLFDEHGATLVLNFTGQWTEQALDRLAKFLGKHDLEVIFGPDGITVLPRVR